MRKFSEKIFLPLLPPSEENPKSDQQQLLDALTEHGYLNVTLPLPLLGKLHSLCQEADYKITATLVCREKDWIITALEKEDTTAFHYGLAVDYGSTTIVMQLVDMNTGTVLAQAREINGQAAYGSDILTRITYTMEHPAHADDLQMATLHTFHQLMDQLTAETGISARDCSVMILSGNTTMIHFLLKLDARTVFFSPYAPVTLDPGWFWGQELGMDFSGMIYIIPAASNYVGGDIVSGLLTLDFRENEEIKLFFDIGTNGELVIGNKEWMLAGAGAAGPALEGYISRFGMRAASGAVDSVKIQNNQLYVTTIDHQPPVGICGSGIIDLLAEMRLHGWIDIAGKLNPDTTSQIIYLPEEQQYVVVYATAEQSAQKEALYFSQTDIDQYLDTKAAASTMIDCLLETAGCSINEIAHCYLSGAFSAHSNLESAITIGIFPDLPREKYSCIVNSSLDGARTLLLDCSRLEDLQYFKETLYCVQFASIPDFLIKMQAAKFIPHTDMERYPSVTAKLHEQKP